MNNDKTLKLKNNFILNNHLVKYKMRRVQAWKIMSEDENGFEVSIFDIPVKFVHGNYRSTGLYGLQNLIEACYFQKRSIVKQEEGIPYVSNKISKTHRFFGKNVPIKSVFKAIAIQIAKRMPAFSTACRYFGIKPTLGDIDFCHNLPPYHMELEPAYIIHAKYLIDYPYTYRTFYNPSILSEDKRSINWPDNRIDVYKSFNDFINKDHIRIMNKSSILFYREYIKYNLDLSIYENPIESTRTNNIVKTVNMLCHDLHLSGSPTFGKELLKISNDHQIFKDLKFITKKAAAYSKKKGCSRKSVDKLLEVADWIREEKIKFDANQVKKDFQWFINKSDEWHATMWKKRNIRKLSWTPIIESFEYKNVNVKELTKSEELFEEGHTMRHCVSGYDSLCTKGNRHIFHLQHKKAKATLDVVIENIDESNISPPRQIKKAKIAQLKGVANQAIKNGSEIDKASKALISLINKKLSKEEIATC